MNVFKTAPKQYSAPKRAYKNESVSILRSEFKEVVKKEYIMKENHFPELNSGIKKGQPEASPIHSELNYKNASLKEIPKVVDEWKKQKGWHYISQNENREVIKEYIGDSEIEYEPTIHEEMNMAIQKMEYNWNDYKEKYIELYGEDVYEIMHEMVNYEHIPDYYEDESNEEDFDDEEYDYENY